MMGIWDRIFHDADRAMKQATLDLMEPAERESRFLDCGPGNCEFTAVLVAKLRTKLNVAADTSASRLAIARNKGYEQVRCDFNDLLPFPDGNFDVIHAGQIIEHLDNTDGFAAELFRILRPGGYAVISTPNMASWHTIAWLIAGRQPHVAMVSDRIVRWKIADDEWDEPKHRRLFTAQGLKMLLAAYGFAVESVRGAGFYPLTGKAASLFGEIDQNHAAYIVVKVRKGNQWKIKCLRN